MRLRSEAVEYRFKNGYDIPVQVLAQKAGNAAQLYTQHAYMRPLCASTIMMQQPYYVALMKRRDPRYLRLTQLD
jgi:20S proteasome alpha/beta subunit